ncbi:MAG: DNA polymerase IV [Planctomycetota bacterium]
MFWQRAILHVDMDAFFASVEQRDAPELRGKPVLVGGTGKRGVVSAASYEARPFGCRSAMPMSVALRLCPHAIVVKGRFDAYREANRKIMAIFQKRTDLVQPISIDEAFLDVSGSQRLFGDPVDMARAIRAEVHDATALTCSVGVAKNKFLAKLASDLDKPDGLTVIEPGTEQATLDPLDIGRIWGIGPKTAQKLRGRGLRTIADLRELPDGFLDRSLGKLGRRVRALIHGVDERQVHSDRKAKGISQEQTFGDDIGDPDVLRSVLLGQIESVAGRLRRSGRRARTVQVKLRFGDFRTYTRRRTLGEPTDVTRELWQAVEAIFDAWAVDHFAPLRLIGCGVSDIVDGVEVSLFPDPQRDRMRAVDKATDAIREKFGKSAIVRGNAPIRR